AGGEPPDACRRAGEPPVTARPAGTYHSQELQAYATLAAGGEPGSATVTVGLARPRTLSPASDGVWAGDGLTVRLLDGGAGLEISLYGARRRQVARTRGPPPPRPRRP